MNNNQIYKSLRREIELSREIIRGSVVYLDRLCGKPNCRCLQGHKHRSLYLSRSYKGKTTMKYVPKKHEQTILAAARRYQRIRNLLSALSELNLKKLFGGR